MEKEFLEKAILKGRKDDGQGLENFKVTDITLEGSGFATVLNRIELSWKKAEKELPSVVITKSPNCEGTTLDKWAEHLFGDNPEQKNRIMAMLTDFIQNSHRIECDFYELVGNKGAVPCPIVYHTNHQDNGQPMVIVMEDMKPKGMEVAIQDGLRLDQVLEITEAIARMQAYSMKNKSLLKEFPPLEKWSWRVLAEMFPKVGAGLTQARPDLQVKFENFNPFITEDYIYNALNSAEELKVPTVLVSADIAVRNLFFASDPSQKNGAGNLVGIVDWQLTHSGQPATDIARLLVSSCRSSLRRQHRDEVLRHFHQTLCSCLESEPFSLDDLHRCYDRIFFFAVSFFIFNVADALHRGTGSPESVGILLDDTAAAIDDAIDILRK